mgnify:CR=1 FL=1
MAVEMFIKLVCLIGILGFVITAVLLHLIFRSLIQMSIDVALLKTEQRSQNKAMLKYMINQKPTNGFSWKSTKKTVYDNGNFEEKEEQVNE